MDFFDRLDSVDRAINRGYARWSRWIWAGLLLPVVVWCAWLVWASIWGPPTGPVTLIIHSDIDRPILGFSVNGVAGANAFAHGGGKATCCGSISGKTAKVVWTLEMTHEQYLKGLRLETRRVDMPMPERKWGENYLHVYFLPGDNVRLWWGTGFIHPKTTENARERAIRLEGEIWQQHADNYEASCVLAEWQKMSASQHLPPEVQRERVINALNQARAAGMTSGDDKKIYAFYYLEGGKKILESAQMQVSLQQVAQGTVSLEQVLTDHVVE